MKKPIETALLLLLLAATTARSADVIVKVAASGTGTFRIQKIETLFVTSDRFAGLFNDSVVVEPGEYRVELFPETVGQPLLAYFDISIGENSAVTPLSKPIRVSSYPYGGEKVRIKRVRPQLHERPTSTEIWVDNLMSEPWKIETALPFTDSTAWSNRSFNGTLRKKISLSSTPEGAEVWLNDKRLDAYTSTSFFVPLSGSLDTRDSLLIRKSGYANLVIPIDSDDSPLKLNVELKKVQ